MFNSIHGVITYKGTQTLFLQTGGIEWDISLSAASIKALPETGREAKIFTFLYHRDDAMKVYGFATENERELFLELCKITGIGPKQALKFLSGIEPADFLLALDTEDVDALARIPGLGKKTASRIILSMRGKLSKTEGSKASYDDIVNALTDMGFDKNKAQETVVKLVKEIAGLGDSEAAEGTGLSPADTEKEIFRKAIVLLSNK